MKWFKVLVFASVLASPAVVGAQGAEGLTRFVGTWAKSGGKSSECQPVDRRHEIYRRLVVQPDSTMIWNTVCVDGADTLASVTLIEAPRPIVKGQFGMDPPSTFMHGDTIFFNRSGGSLVVQGEQLFLTRNGDKTPTETFQRTTSQPKPPIATILASGVRSGQPMPAHSPTRTGTLADLIGVWERTDGDATTRDFMVFRPDSTTLRVRYRLKLGLATANWSESWRGWERLPNDSLITRKGPHSVPSWMQWLAVLTDQQLAIYENGRRLSGKPDIYQPVDSLPKQP